MDLNKASQILDSLASGFSPLTGEKIQSDSVLNEREVIRALQIAIDYIKISKSRPVEQISIAEEDIKNVLRLFRDQSRTVTVNALVGFFLGNRKFKNDIIQKNELYGKLRNVYSQGGLIDFFTEYLIKNNIITPTHIPNNKYDNIDFFRKTKFNRLSENTINQIKERVQSLGIIKSENLAEYIVNARLNHLRAYEPWTEKETELLKWIIKYTNDLDLMSECFQRGKGSIETVVLRLLYEEGSIETS